MKTSVLTKSLMLLALGGLLILSGCIFGGRNKHKDFKLRLPESAGKIKCERLTERQTDELNTKEFRFLSTPYRVTQNGDDHVRFDQMAKVSFAIPKKFPKDRYINLAGVLITDEGPTYKIPDYDDLQKGILSFETSHFCLLGWGEMSEEQRKELFIERTANSGWSVNITNKDIEGTVKEKLLKTAEEVGLGENDFMGIAMREVLGDNDFAKEALDMIDAYDSDEMAEHVSEKLAEYVTAKTLGLLFKKLKGDKVIEVEEYNELKDEHETKKITIEGKNTKLVEFMKTHFSPENVQKIGTELGDGDWQKCGRLGIEYVKDFNENKLKDFATKLFPYVKTVQTSVRAMKVVKKYWASNESIEIYKDYAKWCKKRGFRDGVMKDGDWAEFLVYERSLAKSESNFGMTVEQIREQLVKRFQNETEIQKRKDEIRKSIDLWESDAYELTKSDAFKVKDKNGDIDVSLTKDGKAVYKFKYDYTQRLTRIHNLMERFRGELVKNGDIPGRKAGKSVEETLCEIVGKYLEVYPNNAEFYKWMLEEGYYENKFKKYADGMDDQRSWWLIRTEINRTPNTAGVGGSFWNYFATETQHWIEGATAEDDYHWETMKHEKSVPFGFKGTIDAPPAWMEAGDTLVLHSTLDRTTGPCIMFYWDNAGLTFEDENIPMGFVSDWALGASVERLNGSTRVGSRPGEESHGDWDFKVVIPKGYKNELRALNYVSCGCRTHWVYRWCSAFEKDEPLPEKEK